MTDKNDKISFSVFILYKEMTLYLKNKRLDLIVNTNVFSFALFTKFLYAQF